MIITILQPEMELKLKIIWHSKDEYTEANTIKTDSTSKD